MRSKQILSRPASSKIIDASAPQRIVHKNTSCLGRKLKGFNIFYLDLNTKF